MPPAFRLSQDQTLQLNFLARTDPDARCHPYGPTETDTFTIRVYPRNEFVQTFLIKTYPERLLLPPAGKAEGQSGRLLFNLRRSVIHLNCKAQTSSMASQTIDQGRSLTCVKPQGCLRSLLRPSRFRERRLGSSDPPEYISDVLTHILAIFRLFTCQRTKTNSRLFQSRLRAIPTTSAKSLPPAGSQIVSCGIRLSTPQHKTSPHKTNPIFINFFRRQTTLPALFGTDIQWVVRVKRNCLRCVSDVDSILPQLKHHSERHRQIERTVGDIRWRPFPCQAGEHEPTRTNRLEPRHTR